MPVAVVMNTQTAQSVACEYHGTKRKFQEEIHSKAIY